MKNFSKLFGMLTLIISVIFAFAFAACDSGGAASTVTNVTVAPASATVMKGVTQTFSAAVAGTNSPAQTITWSIVETNKNASTTISASGTLTVAAAEALTSLTVRATATADTSKSGTAAVTIIESNLPSVTSVTVTPSSAVVKKGSTQTFSAAVAGTNNPAQTVSWSIVETNKNASTTISAGGTLAVAAAETLSSLTVRATATADAGKSGTAAVAITNDAVPVAIPLHSKWPFPIGAAANHEYDLNPSNEQFSLLGHFNVLVAENAMKPDAIMPREWQNWQQPPAPYNADQPYRWTAPDVLVNYAEANNIKIRGHRLFGHGQIPEVFFKTDSVDSDYVTKEVLYTRMEQHAKNVFEKYGGRIGWWDVVNECVGDDGNPRTDGGEYIGNSDGRHGFNAIMEASGLTGDARYEWVVNAFKYARKYADENGGQNVKLILNDYSFEEEWTTVKRNGFFRLLDYLIKNGAPVDGVGIQCHAIIFNIDSYINSIDATIDQITTRTNPVSGKKLIVQITELDISLYRWDDSSLTIPASEINTRLQSQAYMYRGLFDVFIRKYNEGKLEMVLLWGVYDGGSWKNDIPIEGRTDHPLLFDRQFQPKPAFNSLITGPSNR